MSPPSDPTAISPRRVVVVAQQWRCMLKQRLDNDDNKSTIMSSNNNNSSSVPPIENNTATAAPPPTNNKAIKQLLCGGIAGATAKTVTAPLSRLTILYQVHSMVTTKKHHPKFALSLDGGFRKIVERGGLWSMWRGNGTSVLHRFPYSAINFYVYERMLTLLHDGSTIQQEDDTTETTQQIARRLTLLHEEEEEEEALSKHRAHKQEDTTAKTKFLAGATAGSVAVVCCYPLDLVRTRLTTELEGREHYRGMVDAFRKIYSSEGFSGFYSGLAPTLLVAVPNFAISYTVYGTLKEQALDDDLFYNLRQIDADSGEKKLGFVLTLICGAFSGTLATLATFPMDTIRRRMQIQNLHLEESERLTAGKHIRSMVTIEGTYAL